MTTDSPNHLNAPWSLHIDRDGTEDVAVILDSDGYELARSTGFWMPEAGSAVPVTLVAMRAMKAAPKLLAALESMVKWAKLHNLTMADLITGGQAECPVITNAREAIAEATDDLIGRGA